MTEEDLRDGDKGDLAMHSTHYKPKQRLEQTRSKRPPRKLGALIAVVVAVGLMGVVAAPALATTYSVTDLGSLGFGESHGLACAVCPGARSLPLRLVMSASWGMYS